MSAPKKISCAPSIETCVEMIKSHPAVCNKPHAELAEMFGMSIADVAEIRHAVLLEEASAALLEACNTKGYKRIAEGMVLVAEHVRDRGGVHRPVACDAMYFRVQARRPDELTEELADHIGTAGVFGWRCIVARIGDDFWPGYVSPEHGKLVCHFDPKPLGTAVH